MFSLRKYLADSTPAQGTVDNRRIHLRTGERVSVNSWLCRITVQGLQLRSSDGALGDLLWKRIDTETARILFGASGPAAKRLGAHGKKPAHGKPSRHQDHRNPRLWQLQTRLCCY